MLVVVIVLNDLSYMDDILEVFVRLGVRGATIVDSYGMAKGLRESETLNYLMKGPIDRAVPEKALESKTIFSVIEKVQAEFVIKTIDNLLKDSKSESAGFIFSLPVYSINPIK